MALVERMSAAMDACAGVIGGINKKEQRCGNLRSFLFRINVNDIICRGARQIQLTSYDHDDGEMPIHGGRSLLPFSHGSHACLHGDDCGAEMFFSSYYFLFNVMCYRL